MTLFYAAAPGLLRLHPPADTETHHLPTSIEMARAATLENVGEAGGGASAPLPHRRPAACHSALPNGHLQNGQQNRREQPGAATPPPSPPGPADAVSGEQSAPSRTDQRPHREAAHRPTGGGPLPRREATLEARRVDTSGVARQLRTIGDQLNASMLREKRREECRSLSQLSTVQEAGCTLNSSPADRRAHRDKQPHLRSHLMPI
ncbi:bcl-2-binding component 3 isoform X1 [Syngnathoides biaculeatus]|uniref:bcl-2-binding component 3 isoform X1 n=1 Tax=Syngnathoides biaculeatus TaxID=300417 RepID=UPI002ADD4B4D|nr:bcl-2-binding component 3 isoform X1 [Syngnathoides biaculeatus]